MRFILITVSIMLFSSQLVMASEMLLRLHGSNTIGAELGPELVKYWLHNNGYKDIQINKLKAEEIEISATDNFRFKKGSFKLDNKSRRDVQRLADYVSRPENKSKKVMLFGFSESSETMPVFALDLSVYRADWVSELLVKNGIDPVRVRGYGDTIPVASNEDAGGRHKNRRVEVWLK